MKVKDNTDGTVVSGTLGACNTVSYNTTNYRKSGRKIKS